MINNNNDNVDDCENSEYDCEHCVWEAVEDKADELAEFIKDINIENKSDIANRLIHEILVWCSYNHYEALGILEEVKLEYRDISKKVMEEERMNEKEKEENNISDKMKV